MDTTPYSHWIYFDWFVLLVRGTRCHRMPWCQGAKEIVFYD